MCHWRLFSLAGLAVLAACDFERDNNQQEFDTGEDTPDTTDTPDTGPDGAPSLQITHEPYELTELAVEAVAAAPDWLQDDLHISLGKLDEDLQNELGALVADLDDPYLIDEVAFAMAHTSPEVLDYGNFHPELLVINAELLYQHDPSLDYVELVDVGEPGVDADYYTTATYQVGEGKDGEEVVEKTIEADIYYWYVVHPRLEDELPYFLDAWASDNPKDAENGLFWREFLWDVAADECTDGRECPLLLDALAGVEVLWKGKAETRTDNGAIGELIQYVWDAIDFGAGDERPVQPSRIYTVGAGNCGEHADLTCAAARIGLIPCRNVGASSNDHTWDEFWDERWVAWEPIGTHVDYFNYYGGTSADYYSYNYQDDDCDGTADLGEDSEDHDGDGWTIADGDCNDGDADAYPDADERLNGLDDDCDGIADEGFDPFDFDADDDGWSINDGDCDDGNASINPDTVEEVNGYDDNCDGYADEGTKGELDESDADGDGFSILDGDCDDGDAAVYPEASEAGNGYDDNCDGYADEGLESIDRDGDGYTSAEECDDLDSGDNPDADDPPLSTNRLYMMHSNRGDTYMDVELTENYGVPSWLEFVVTDDNGLPVDGAIVTIFGTWAVYGYPEYWAWAGEVVTDLSGYAIATVGKHNPYGFAVYSDVGDEPGGDYLNLGPEFTEPDETYSIEVELPGDRVLPEVEESDLTGGAAAQATLQLSFDVQSHRIAANGGRVGSSTIYYGSFSLQQDGGHLDSFVVNHANYELFAAGEPFQAMAVDLESVGSTTSLDLPLTESWTLILYNPSVASTMVGDLNMSVQPAGDESWTGESEPLEQRFRIDPQDYLSVVLLPAS